MVPAAKVVEVQRCHLRSPRTTTAALRPVPTSACFLDGSRRFDVPISFHSIVEWQLLGIIMYSGDSPPSHRLRWLHQRGEPRSSRKESANVWGCDCESHA